MEFKTLREKNRFLEKYLSGDITMSHHISISQCHDYDMLYLCVINEKALFVLPGKCTALFTKSALLSMWRLQTNVYAKVDV